MGSEPTQTCQLCGRQVVVTPDGRGFPPKNAERKLRKLCAVNGCPCDPAYSAGISPDLQAILDRLEAPHDHA